MKALSLVLKVLSVAIVAVPAFFVFFKEYRFNRRRRMFEERSKGASSRASPRVGWAVFIGLSAGTLLSIALIWVDPFLQDQIAKAELASAKPQPVLKIFERTDSCIILEISSPTTNKHPMQNLSLSFDIPGKNAKCRIVDATRAENCSITNSWRMKVGGDPGSEVSGDTVSERVDVSCKSILPSGFVRAQVDYDRTRRRPVPGSIKAGITNQYYLPVMDLRDYTPCLYTWLYLGQEILEKSVLSLTNLACIIEDNENLYRTVRQEDWSNTPPEIKKVLTNAYPREFFEGIEQMRKRW